MDVKEQEIGFTAKYIDNNLTIRQRMKVNSSTVKRVSLAGIVYLVVMGLFFVLL